MQALSSTRVRLALVFFAAIVAAVVLSMVSGAPKSDAQVTGYGPQSLPDQVINSSSGRGGSKLGLAVGAGTGVVILGGAAFYGYRHNHPAEHPYP